MSNSVADHAFDGHFEPFVRTEADDAGPTESATDLPFLIGNVLRLRGVPSRDGRRAVAMPVCRASTLRYAESGGRGLMCRRKISNQNQPRFRASCSFSSSLPSNRSR